MHILHPQACPVLTRRASPILRQRLVSTNSSQPNDLFPFPSHARPTPHQIFHLPLGASPQDVKTRYYELVRAHHPDSSHCRSLSPAERHRRFQSITAAYDVLRGKKLQATDPYMDEVMRRKRAYYSHYSGRPRPEYSYPGRHGWHASADDRWKDRIILLVGITTLAAGLMPGLFLFPAQMDRRHHSAVSNLAQAQREAREFGDERMRELRKRVREMKGSEDATSIDNVKGAQS